MADEPMKRTVDTTTADPQLVTDLDPRLAALDPDRERPAEVICSEGLTLSFGAKTVLTDVNMSFQRGSITALIGPTGSGKSTFLRTLNRMNDKVVGFKYSGDVTLDKKSIWGAGQDLLTFGAGWACSSNGRTRSPCPSATTWWLA